MMMTTSRGWPGVPGRVMPTEGAGAADRSAPMNTSTTATTRKPATTTKGASEGRRTSPGVDGWDIPSTVLRRVPEAAPMAP